jgi:hypothetical protein
MLAEAYYDNGKIEFTRNYRFKHNRFKINVEVPDEEVSKEHDNKITPPNISDYSLKQEVVAYSSLMKEKLDRIRNAPAPPDDELPPLSLKYLERLKAFALRDK